MPEQAGGEAGSIDAAVVSDASAEAVATSSPETGAGLIASDHEAPQVDAPKSEALEPEVPRVEAPKVEAPSVETPSVETSRVEAPRVEQPKAEPRATGQILIMPPANRSGPRPEEEAAPAKRRMVAMAAMIALAAIAGALSGALATAGMMHFGAKDGSASQQDQAQAQTQVQSRAQELQASVARIDADVLALKASVEHTSKVAMGQFNRASDRLDKLEKAQAEPAAKLARLSDTVDKLRAAQPTAPAAAAKEANKETTGSITVAAAAPVPMPVPSPKPEVGRLPTVEGWVLRDVSRGGALIEGRQGLYEVYAGDPVPGLGRVDAIRRQDGRWVVVTSKGLIVAR